MRIRDVLHSKGSTVATVRPETTVRGLLAVLSEHNIGAVVVSPDGNTISGIASERDVVRQMHKHGVALFDQPVSQIMTTQVRTCGPDEKVDGLCRVMTEHRIRHLPVTVDGKLVGIVSIGDVVKSALSLLESERAQLVGYIQS